MMDHIFQKLHEVDPNNSEAIKDVLAVFFQSLQKQTNIESYRWLRALATVLSRFPRYCVSHRNTIETFLSHFSSSSNYFNAIEAAKCAHALQQVRPSQEKTATPKVCWREHQIVCCNIAHKLIGSLFPNAVDIYKGSEDDQQLQFQSTLDLPIYKSLLESMQNTHNGYVNKKYVLTTKLKNVLIYLQAMLVEVYPVAKPVRPQLFLEVILRALSASSGSKLNLDDSSIASIKIQALKTLDALILCLGSNLVPFTALIYKLVMQTLKWSSENINEESRKVRCAAYRSLSNWLRRMRCAKPPHEDVLIAHISADITRYERAIQLTMNSRPTRHLSKKAKRKLANSMLQESSISAHMPGEKTKVALQEENNDEVATAALDCAETLFIVSGIFLKRTTYKFFIELLVKECYKMDVDEPMALYWIRVLDGIRRAAVPGASPTHHCLQLYMKFSGSHSQEVSKLCSQALLDIRLQLHCAPPSLNFVCEQQKQVPQEKAKKISERNRAVLNSLLSNPYEDVTENLEVIDISEEPANKKPRKSTKSDRISISSDSDESECIVEEDSNHIVIQHSTFSLGNKDNEISNGHEEISYSMHSEPESNDEAIEIEEPSKSPNIADGSGINNEGDKEIPQSNKPIENVSLDEGDTETDHSSYNIHDAKTQVPHDVSNDTVDRVSPASMEVVYDYPNAINDKVNILEGMEGENLPSSNETDDVQITCGQIVQTSQEAEEKGKENNVNENGVTEVNGHKSPEKLIDTIVNVTEKIATAKDVTVEDMLADFVDEVVENK